MDRCDICGDPLEDGQRVWNITFDYIKPKVIQRERIVCCHDCKIEIREYIHRFSNLELVKRRD